MHLIYVDESGNSGNNLNDPDQPIFLLCAMIVPEIHWQSLEKTLRAAVDKRFPGWQSIDKFEIHGSDLRRGDGPFKGMPVKERIEFRDSWMRIGADHGIRLCARNIVKKAYASWLADAFGQGVLINPHIAAFAILSRSIDSYLKSLTDKPLGILISDENKEIVADVEKSIRALRLIEGGLRLGQIVEKGFFIDSSKSLPLQLCDLFTLSLRKNAEQSVGLTPKSVDESGIAIARHLLYDNREQDLDVIKWLKTQHERKKETARG